VATINSTADTLKINPGEETGQTVCWFNRLFTTTGQGTERVYSFNPGARRTVRVF